MTFSDFPFIFISKFVGISFWQFESKIELKIALGVTIPSSLAKWNHFRRSNISPHCQRINRQYKGHYEHLPAREDVIEVLMNCHDDEWWHNESLVKGEMTFKRIMAGLMGAIGSYLKIETITKNLCNDCDDIHFVQFESILEIFLALIGLSHRKYYALFLQYWRM